MSRPIAIVTDALWRKSVSAIRALGASGYSVFALGDGRLTTGFYSRYTSRRFIGPVAAEDPDGFGETLGRAIEATGGEPAALLAMEDATCEWLLSHGGELAENIEWLLPPADSFALARDKARTFSLAEQLGIPAPRTYAPASVGELGDLVAANPMEEFVVKPRTGSGSSGVVYGSDIRATSLEKHWELHGPLLLQERIPRDGVAYGVSLLFDRAGRERAAFAHRRLREYPVSGGPSTQRVEHRARGAALLQPTAALLAGLVRGRDGGVEGSPRGRPSHAARDQSPILGEPRAGRPRRRGLPDAVCRCRAGSAASIGATRIPRRDRFPLDAAG